jgi:outer membrane protein assembly factor BamB/tRNA A-37 threonylcarbamoyl transferase component Bud32
MSLIKKKGGSTKHIGKETQDQQSHGRDPLGTSRPAPQPPQEPQPTQEPAPQQPPARDPLGTARPPQQPPARDPLGTARPPQQPPQQPQARDPLGTSTPTGAAPQSAAGESQTLPVNTILQQRYIIEGVIGIGGMSVVYRGRDMRFKEVVRPCAIKEMYQSSPDSQTRMLSLQFFEREAGMLATLSHPAIPKVYDFFEENGRVYLVLELISGKDLEAILEERGQPLSEAAVGGWAIQICDVLNYLHSHEPEPIVFRDMKPSNVMLMENERVSLVDFGIARLIDRANRKGTMIGTEGYAAPEQFRGIAGPPSDIYALGATLHQLLTNTDPRTETPFTFHERPIRSFNTTVSPEMEAVVMRAVEYEMEGRWTNAEEFKQALLSVPNLAGAAPASTPGISVPAFVPSTNASTELIWRFKCEDEIRSSPCVSDGMLFVGCYDTNLYALDAERGEFRWKFPTEGGINSSPDVWQDMVFFGSEDGGVYALDIRQGKRRWVFKTENAVRSSPRVLERVIFVGSDDQHIYAIDGMRGTVLWKYRTWMPIRSSACIGEDAIFIGGSDGNVYSLDIRTGRLRFKQRTQKSVTSTPALGEGLIFVGSNDTNLYALDIQGGWPAWRYRTGHSISSSPAVLGKRVFVGSADGVMYALDTKKGRLSWKFETDSQIASSPRIDGGRLYFGATNGSIYCLDAATGDLIWEYQAEGPIVSTAAVVNGVVYIGSMDYHIYALKA